jgi:hypothetical protein
VEPVSNRTLRVWPPITTSAISTGPNLVFTVNSGIGPAAGGVGVLIGLFADVGGLT